MERRDDEHDTRHIRTNLQQDDRLRKPQRDDSPQHHRRKHAVVHQPYVTAAPRTHTTAARPQNVSERSDHAFPDTVPQHIKIYIEDRTNKLEDVFDEFMITETQSYELKFELEEGKRGAYMITRDDNIIANNTVESN